MGNEGCVSNVTVHYTEKFSVSGRRVLVPLSTIDGVGGGYRHSDVLILPTLPIIAKKSCSDGHQLLNFGDTRISGKLMDFDPTTQLECLLINENIEEVRAVCGEIYPQICTKIPTRTFLQNLSQRQLLRKVLADYFGCSSNHKNVDFSVDKLATLLSPNGPAKATINRALPNKAVKNPKQRSATKSASAQRKTSHLTVRKQPKTGEELLLKTVQREQE